MLASFARRRRTSAHSWQRCFTAVSLGLALACRRAEDAPRDPQIPTNVENVRDSIPASSASSTRASDASEAQPPAGLSASCSGLECSGCPAPAIDLGSGGTPVWSRHPMTGDCCRYDDRIAAPENWPWFYTETECQSDCRCSVLDDYHAEDGSYTTERTSLDCRCSKETCPATIAEAEQLQCLRTGIVERRVGCGKVFVVDGGGLYGDGWLFEPPLESTDGGAASPRLIGAYQFTDAATGPCQTGGWVAGIEFDCESAVACQVCGESFPTPVPPCE